MLLAQRSYGVTTASLTMPNTACQGLFWANMKRHMLIYKENLPTVVAVKQNLILQPSSYHKILKNLFLSARVWAPIPVSKSPRIRPCNSNLFVPPVSAINCRPDSPQVSRRTTLYSYSIAWVVLFL